MKVEKLLPGVKKNILLKNYTTFKIGGPAKYFFAAKNKEDLIKAVSAAKKIKLPFFILGGGSNILVADKGYNGLVINFQFSIFNFQKNKIVAGAGTKLGELVSASARRGLTGLEWAAGIPGTVGGAIYGNAGASGKSMADIVKEVEVLDTKDLRFKSYDLRKCKFGYKDSIFKKKKDLIILSVMFQLRKGDKKAIKNKIEKNLEERKKRQPLNLSSTGSIFKNPRLRQACPSGRRGFGGQASDFFAGELIEKCGLKGKKIGKAKISEKHANFIVNLGGAKAKDVKKLINLTKKKVKKKFGITLEEEIQEIL